MTLSVSEKGHAFIAAREGCSLTAYRDSKMWAIGFGSNDQKLNEGDTIIFPLAVSMFVQDAQKRVAALSKTFGDVSPAQHVTDALCCLSYNIGVGGLQRNVALVNAVRAFCKEPSNKILRDAASYQIVMANFDEVHQTPFNASRRYREAILLCTADYGDLTKLNFWPLGTLPRKNPPQVVPMPRFLTGA